MAISLANVKKRDPKKGYGTLGTPIKLFANHYLVKTPETGFFYRFDIDMVLEKSTMQKGDAGDGKKKQPVRVLAEGEKKELSKALKRKIMNFFLKKNAVGLFNGILPVYDGQKLLYTMKDLKLGPDGMSDTVELPADPDGGARNVMVTVKPCNPCAVSWKSLYDAVERRSQDNPIVVIQCINSVLREAALATGTNIAINRSFFTKELNAPQYIGAGREIWSGFYQSVRPCQWKLTLNLDKAHTVFYTRMPALDFLGEFLKGALLTTDFQRKEFEREIKGLKVETTYGGTRRQRVTGVSRESAASSRFDHNGTSTTVVVYFRTQFKITLKHPELPCLKIGNKGSLIPIELVTMLEQKVDKRLTDTQTQEMVRRCTQSAPDRKRSVQQIRDRSVNYETSTHLKEFKIGINNKMVSLEARVLPLPEIKMVKGDKPILVDKQHGTWDPRDDHFALAIELKNWAVVSLVDPRRVNVEYFIEELVKMGKKKGMNMAAPDRSCVPNFDRKSPDFGQIITQIKAAFEKRDQKNKLQMVMFIPDSPDMYAAIKRVGDVEMGVVTQVILGKTISKNTDRGMLQLVSNMLLKMNGKLGGTNSHVANFGQMAAPPALIKQTLTRFLAEPTIIFGADVTHPSPGESTDKPSIAAVVASHNSAFTAYSARVRAQSHGKEMMTDLRDMVEELLIEFRSRTGFKPLKIIFYRDGVSEGQFGQVMVEELNSVQAACLALEPEGTYKPAITYIIVGKRHHTRMFCQNANDAMKNKGMNVPPGTITDKDICHYSEMDWYLCSHGGIQGTSRPAHYNVLYDDSDFSADEIELFSYYLTFCYARCNRSVSIPASAYYAHHVAFRARHHLSDVPDFDSASQPSNIRGNRPAVDMAALNQRIKIHDNLKGMYFV